MRRFLTVVLLAATVSPASALTDRFAPDNPWYEHFAADCRVGENMRADCHEAIMTTYKAAQGTQEATCDFAKFWQISDELMKDKYFPVLPWQYGVEAILSEPGVCSSY